MNEKTVSSQRVFNGCLLKLDVLEVELDNGRRARREIVRHPGALAIWARAPDGRFVFVRQFRKAIEQELLEVVADSVTVAIVPVRVPQAPCVRPQNVCPDSTAPSTAPDAFVAGALAMISSVVRIVPVCPGKNYPFRFPCHGNGNRR